MSLNPPSLLVKDLNRLKTLRNRPCCFPCHDWEGKRRLSAKKFFYLVTRKFDVRQRYDLYAPYSDFQVLSLLPPQLVHPEIENCSTQLSSCAVLVGKFKKDNSQPFICLQN